MTYSKNYEAAHAELANQLKDAIDRKLPKDLNNHFQRMKKETSLATRAASGEAINAIAAIVPSLFGGSADLAGSNKTTIKESGDFLPIRLFWPQYMVRCKGICNGNCT